MKEFSGLLAVALFGAVFLAGCVTTGQGTVKTDVNDINISSGGGQSTATTQPARLNFNCVETRGAGSENVKVTFTNPGTTTSSKTCTTVKLVKGGGQVQSTQTVCAEAVAAGASTTQEVNFIISPGVTYRIECTAS